MTHVKTPALVIAMLFALEAGAAHAELSEQSVKLLMEVKSGRGEVVKRETDVTIFRETSRTVSPFIIVTHGRLVPRDARAKMGRWRIPEISKYFVEKGFVVFALTRLGYNETADDDVEETGTDCEHRDYKATFTPGVEQVRTVLEYVRQQPYVDKTRGLLVGNSFGGMIVLTSAATNPPGIIGAVNFSGGSGGDEKRPGKPCNAGALENIFAEIGKGSRTPNLWLYSANDQYWGPAVPREWQRLYEGGGAQVSFVQLPPHGENGHVIFAGNPQAWHAPFEAFIERLGFKPN